MTNKTTTTVYSASWRDYGGGYDSAYGGGYEEADNMEELRRKVFGRAFAPVHHHVLFLKHKRIQEDSKRDSQG